MIVHSDTCVCERILTDLPAHVYVVDLKLTKLAYSNPSLRWALGYPESLSEESVLEALLHPDDYSRYLAAFAAPEAAGDGAVVDLEARMKAVDGSWRWIASRVRVFKCDDSGSPALLLGVSPEVTAPKLVMRDIERERHQNHLTDLLNRKQFIAAMDRVIASGRNPSTLCICDIDYFQGVNDSYGHLAGDRVLQAFASILKRTLRHDDVIARLGGDEFGILFPGQATEQCLAPLERIREQLAGTRFPVPCGEVFSVTSSQGMAQYDGGGSRLDWMEEADRAVSQAKRRGRNQTSRALA